MVPAAYTINKPPEFMLGKRFITGAVKVDGQQLADVYVPMKELLD